MDYFAYGGDDIVLGLDKTGAGDQGLKVNLFYVGLDLLISLYMPRPIWAPVYYYIL